jgi:hypothetical protein
MRLKLTTDEGEVLEDWDVYEFGYGGGASNPRWTSHQQLMGRRIAEAIVEHAAEEE